MAKVTYKPGWSFNLYDNPPEGVWIAITAELPDAYHPGESTTVCIRSAVPPIPDVDYFHVWLGWRLDRCETHERREFYRVAGLIVDDPHAPGANDERETAHV